MNRARLVLVLTTVLAATLPAAAAPAATPATVVFYRFAGYTTNGTAVDVSGGDHNAVVRGNRGGGVAAVTGPIDQAARFPAPCRPGTSLCPRAILETPHRPELNPGTRPLRYGATVLLPASHTSIGSNVIQKGFFASVSQWKLQIDGTAGAPSCVLVGNGHGWVAKSAVRVADGAWHRVECRRWADTLTVLVDGQVTGQRRIPAGLSLANLAPVRVGGNGLGQFNDQYFGALDDVFAVIG